MLIIKLLKYRMSEKYENFSKYLERIEIPMLYLHQTYFVPFTRCENVSPHCEKGVNEGNFNIFNNNCYLVTC